MENQTRVQAKGCIYLGDLLIFMFGSFMMFAKTANLLGKFAPDDWFGLSPADYGFAAALIIEGFLVWRKVKMWLLPPNNFVEWATDIVTTFIPFGLSLMAQVIDSYVTTGLINSMTQEQKTLITTIVSLLIGIPLLLDIGRTTIENAPAGIFDTIKSNERGGLDGVFSWVGSHFKSNKVLANQPTQVLAKDVLQEELDESVGKPVNPTKGKVKKA